MHKLIVKLCSSIALLLFAWQSLPTIAANPVAGNTGFTTLPTHENGRILISAVRIPKTEPGVSALYLFGGLSRGTSSVPFKVNIYDVTDEARVYNSGWLEYDASLASIP